MNNLDKNNINSNIKDENKQENQNQIHHHHFQVKNTPKGIFPLFINSSDSYVYERKLYCDLPSNIIPPKIFHYPYSLHNFCKTDLLTMNFDLRKNNEIITDPKLNTCIHQDFINNSLELIFPNLTTINQEKTEKEKKLKKEILEIIERKEEMPIEKKNVLLEKPYYLRASTFFTPSLTVISENKGNPMAKKPNVEIREKIDIKEEIKKSFKEIEKIKIGNKHPDKEGVTIKEVYNILPMDIYPNSKFYQYIFPIEPNQEINLSEKIQIPDRFIFRKNESEKEDNYDNYFEPDNQIIYSLYKNEKLKEKKETENINQAEYFSHEKDYIVTNSNEYELFNRYLMFLNKKDHTLKLTAIKDKITLKKHKKSQKENNDDEEGNENYFINQKRERDIIVIPKELEEVEIKKIKKWYKDYGFNNEFNERKINEIDYSEVKEIKQEKEKLIEKEESDYFADKEGENINESIEDNNSPLNKSQNSSYEEKENNEEDEDVLFKDDDGENNEENEEEENRINDINKDLKVKESHNKVIEDD